jgi:hypothetical protein
MNSILGDPYVVGAQIHRSRIDFNRSKEYIGGERAFDDPQAEPLYDIFEHSLSNVVEEALRGSEIGLLIDLHGCRTDESDVFIGTLNGKTVYQHDGHTFGKDIVREHLTRRGWKVAPKIGQPETVFTGRSDGIINRHNISRRPGRYASIQLEVSRAIRLDQERNRAFANDLADAIFEVFR